MKTSLGIILGVLAGILILSVATFLVVNTLISDNEINSAGLPSQSPHPSNSTPFGTIKPSNTPNVKSQTPSATLTASPNPAIKTSVPATVSFSIKVTNFNISAASTGNVTVEITNTGTVDAHNTQAKVTVTSQGEQIQVNGKDYYEQSLGIITAGRTITSQVTLEVSLIDGLKILQSGATIHLTLSSDENTQTVSYDYNP